MSYQIETSPSGVHTTIVTEDHGRLVNILSTTDEGGAITPVFLNQSMARTVHKYLDTGQAAIRKATHLHVPSDTKRYTTNDDGESVVAKSCVTCYTEFPCQTRRLLDEC
jgi:hypothetical protein